MNAFFQNHIVQAVLVFFAIVGLYCSFQYVKFYQANQDAMAEMDMTTMPADESSADPYAGTHIMPDGSVMLGSGDTVAEAEILEDGSVKMPDGTVLEEVPDFRQ